MADHCVDFADASVEDIFTRSQKARMGAKLAVGAEDTIVPGDGIAERPASGDTERQRLLTADVLTRFGRGDRHRHVPVVGR